MRYASYKSYWIQANGKLTDVSNFYNTHEGYIKELFKTEVKKSKFDNKSYFAMDKGWIKLDTYSDIGAHFFYDKVTDEALKALKEFCENNQNKFPSIRIYAPKGSHQEGFDIISDSRKDFEINNFIDNFYKIIRNIHLDNKSLINKINQEIVRNETNLKELKKHTYKRMYEKMWMNL